MGFLSKIGKGLKKTFKKIGKGIKSAFKSIGKFMDKIGIVGQIGLSLLLPGIGAMLGQAFTGLTGAMAGYTGIGSSVINGAGSFLVKAGELAGQMGKSFSTITEGVKNVVGETLKAGANALGVDQALIKAGQTLGSDYLENLGNNIGKANLTSIGDAFGANVENVVNSFSGGVPADSPLLTDGAVTPQPTDVYTPEITTPDVPVASEIKTDSLLAPDASVTPPVVGDPSAVVNRQILTDTDFLDIAQPDFDDPTERGFIGKTYDRAVTAATKMVREAPEKAIEKLGRTITDVPSQLAKRAVGLSPDPVYNQTSYATIVPTIQDAPMVATRPTENPVQYVASNQQSMGLQPFGFNANMYNDATYLTAMRKYGFA